MSFGFSVSDIVECAVMAYRLYDEFKQASGACEEFSRDLLLFHLVLMKTKSNIESEARHLSHSDQATLRVCLDSCKQLLYVQIMGAHMVPEHLEEIGINMTDPGMELDLFTPFHSGRPRLFQGWCQTYEERKFALRIPKLQSAISSHIAKVNILLIQSHQSGNRDSQERIKDRIGESHDLLVKSSTDHALQLDSISDRLDTSQARIESQLQTILAYQQRSRTPIMSQSLDASSPEGRQTWMELGRLLRDEGITPAMIQENRGLIINAMKSTLRDETLLAESIPESYATAPEHHTDNYISPSVSLPRSLSRPDLPPVCYPLSILGSAPPRSPGFTDAFLDRQNHAAGSLDQAQNVDDGVQSLLEGMNGDNSTPKTERADGDYFESEDIDLGGTPFGQLQKQNASVVFRVTNADSHKPTLSLKSLTPILLNGQNDHTITSFPGND